MVDLLAAIVRFLLVSYRFQQIASVKVNNLHIILDILGEKVLPHETQIEISGQTVLAFQESLP